MKAKCESIPIRSYHCQTATFSQIVRGIAVSLWLFFASAPFTCATTFLEGGEGGLDGVTMQTSPGYNPLSTRTFADGPPHSFHLAHSDFANQSVRMNTQIVPQAGTMLNFMSRLGWAGIGQTARVQISTDGGGTWADIYAQAGNDSAGELVFNSRSINLGNYAGQTVQIRFYYTRNTDFTTFSGSADTGYYIVGWFIDLIQIIHPNVSVPVLAEGAENGIGGVTIQSSPGYNPVSNSIFADGPPHAFHLAHPDFVDQSMLLNASFIPQTNSVLRFKSRLAWAGEGQTARVQISTNAGSSWTDIYAQAGTNSAGEESFIERPVSLGGFAGQAIQLRFYYFRDTAFTTFSGSADSGQYVLGWFIDQISINDVTVSGSPNALPVITQQPQSKMAFEGDAVVFSVVATGVGSITYQWNQNGIPITGATAPVLNISSVQSSAAGSYSVVARNGAGSTASSSAALSIFSLVSSAVTDQPAVALSGTVTNAPGIAGIKVNGVPVQTADGFNHWTIPNVALTEGPNSVLISAISSSSTSGVWSTVSTWDIFRATRANLLPFAFNSTSPSDSSETFPKTTIERDVQTGKNHLIFSFRRRIDPLGMTYLVEVSDDLQSWHVGTSADVEMAPVVPNSDGVTETVLVKVLPDVGGSGGPRRFTRVRVALP